MKQITMMVLLALAIDCGQINRANAEAPQPRGGCWSRDIAMRSSSPPVITTVKGRIVAIEHNDNNGQHLAAKELLTWVRLQTETGAFESIYLGFDRYLHRQKLQLKNQDLIEVSGVQIIRPKQTATIVARTITKGNRTWKVDQAKTKPVRASWCEHSG